ncbi:MAG: hypothetical protein MJ156_01445 [Alphaproteobacteria bacterium]|nr:hypothetical protein [Alphaproteobacteria bacterium]
MASKIMSRLIEKLIIHDKAFKILQQPDYYLNVNVSGNVIYATVKSKKSNGDFGKLELHLVSSDKQPKLLTVNNVPKEISVSETQELYELLMDVQKELDAIWATNLSQLRGTKDL